MNIREILDHANFNLDLTDLTFELSDDSLSSITQSILDEASRQISVQAGRIEELELDKGNMILQRDAANKRSAQMADELDDKDAMLKRTGRDCENLRSRFNSLQEQSDERHSRSKAIGNRQAAELKSNPDYDCCWRSILSLNNLAGVDEAIDDSQKGDFPGPRKITAIKLLRKAIFCGLKEAKEAIEARMHFLDEKRQIKAAEADGFFMETGKALEIAWQMASLLSGESLSEHPGLTPDLQQLALDTVEDFIVNNFAKEPFPRLEKED